MSILRLRVVVTRTLTLAALAFAAAFLSVAPAGAAINVISSYAGPIQPDTFCTAEPRAAAFENLAFDPTKPANYGGPANGVATNIPSIDDMQPDLRAGAHADYCIAYTLTPDSSPFGRTLAPDYTPDPATAPVTGDDQETTVVDTPLGFAGNAASIPRCSDAVFNTGAAGLGQYGMPQCAANTRVGDVFLRLSMFNEFIGAIAIKLWKNYSATPTGTPAYIFNLVPGPDDLARFGVAVDPLQADVTRFVIRVGFVGTGKDRRLRSTVEDAPRTACRLRDCNAAPLPLYVESLGLRFWGETGLSSHPELHHAFAENGTQCGVDLSGNFNITTYAGIQAARSSAPHQLTGCDDPELTIRPSVDVTTTETTPSTPTGVKVNVALGQNAGNAKGTALLKDAAVTLPPGLELGAQVGARDGGLSLCSAAAFDISNDNPAACPAGSRVGSVKISSPLISEQLSGDVFLGPQAAVGELPDLYLQASLAGNPAPGAPRVKIIGTTSVSADGQITSNFTDNPQLRFSALELTFEGGPNALFVTPRHCGAANSVSRLTPWNGGGPVDVVTSLAPMQGCEQLPGFAPTVAVQPANATAGIKAPVSVVVSRADRSSWLKDVHVSLPAGQLADLKGLPECPRWAADAGSCPENTRIGTVTSVAGAGPSPLSLTGGLYFVEREAGAVAGAVIIVRAKIGELDLGDVVVPGRINLRPTDAGLDFITSAPERFRGLALNLQSITVALDRPDFALNPSACGPLGYSAQISGSGGESVGAGGSVAYQGCGDRPFAPRLDARLTGEIEPGGHPGMNVTVVTRPGDSTLRRAEVLLPEGVAADLKNVQISCARADFDAVRCPANTKVGNVAARVSITDEVIPGDVYLVKVPGETLPGLGLNFTGRFAQRLMSVVKISSTGRLITRFDTIPDLPLTAFNIDVKSAADGPLQLPPGECAANTRWDGTFGGWGGQTATSQIGLRCAATAKVKLTKGTGLSTRMFDFGGRHLRTLKVTLPSGVTFDTKRAKSKKYQWARLAGSKAKLRFTKRSITITATDKDATNVRLKIKSGALKFSKRAARKKSQTLKLRMVFQGTQAALSFTPGEKNPILIDGAVQTQTVTYKQPSKKSKSKKSKKSSR